MVAPIQTAAQTASSLASSLSANSNVLINPEDDDFKRSMVRWSDLNIRTPSVIIKPSTESDVQKIVQHAIKNKIPFVARSGGSSSWSTVGPEGWIIDLSLLQTITFDYTIKTATIQSGVLTKALNTALSDINFYLPTPTGGNVGFIPFMLGGGSSSISGMYGMAIDSLISARVVIASGELVVASEDQNPDLFWALKGAGQFFGVVTEVTMKMYDIKEDITSWTLFFLPHQVEGVAKALEALVNSDEVTKSPGMAAILAPPGKKDPVVMVSLTHFRPIAEVQTVMQPLLSLSPINSICKVIQWANVTDAGDSLSKPGGYKSQVTCGIQKFSAAQFVALLSAWKTLVAEHPDASSSFFMYTFYSTEGVKRFAEMSSAWSHRDVGIWSMLWVVAPNMEVYNASIIRAEAYITLIQKDQRSDELALFPNHTRVGDVHLRYRGSERIKKLRELKMVWDRDGIFGSEFLQVSL